MTRDYLVEIVVKLLSLQVWLWLWLHPFCDDEHWAWLSEGFPAVCLPRQSPQIDQQDHDPMAGLLRTQVRVSVGRRTEFQNCVCLLLTWRPLSRSIIVPVFDLWNARMPPTPAMTNKNTYLISVGMYHYVHKICTRPYTKGACYSSKVYSACVACVQNEMWMLQVGVIMT